MSYTLLDGRVVEDANDEKLTKRFGSTYTFFKKQHPSLHKLPENEVSEICYTFNKSPYGDTPEKAVARTNDYIKSQMPRWEKEYFNPMPTTPKPMSASANVNANANTAASWSNFGTPNKNNMFTTSSGKSLKQNSWESLGGTKADSFDSFTPMKMPKPAPEPKVPQITPMPQMPVNTYTAQPVSYTQTQPMGFAQMANNATSQSSNPVLNFINSISPLYAAFDTLGILYNAKREMERRRSDGLDNYYHRLGMCEVGQQTPYNSFYPLMGVLGGVAKEALDIYKKTKDGMPLSETLTDSYKDMKNNLEGLNYGLNHPNEDCRVWLEDLDYKNNTWRK